MFGVTPAHVTETLETLLNGRVVSQIIDGNRRYDVVLRVAEADRTTEGLSKLIVETPAGRVPLSSFAQVVDTDGPNQIQRDNTRRRIVVLANTDGSDMAQDHRRHPAACSSDMHNAGRLLHHARGDIPGAGGGLAIDWRCFRWCRWAPSSSSSTAATDPRCSR